MKYCQHYIKGSKQCSLGVEPVNCRSCSMFQVASRRTYSPPTIDSDPSTVYSSDSDTITIPSSTVLYTSSDNEQQLLQSSAVTGGCGCRKK